MSQTCLVFLVDDKFLDGFKVLCFSLHKNGAIWNQPRIVLTTSALVQNDPFVSRNASLKEIPDWFLREIDQFPLSFDGPLPTVEKNRENFITRQRSTFIKLYALEYFGYAKNIFIDSDMVCVGGLEDLLLRTQSASFYACPALLKHHIIDTEGKLLAPDQVSRLVQTHLDVTGNNVSFNSGLFVANREVLGFDTVKKLLKIGRATPHTSDQPIYNKFIKDSGFSYQNLKPWFNMERPYFSVLREDGFIKYQSEMKILHFTGMRKPWWPFSGDENEVKDVKFLYKVWVDIAEEGKIWISENS